MIPCVLLEAFYPTDQLPGRPLSVSTTPVAGEAVLVLDRADVFRRRGVLHQTERGLIGYSYPLEEDLNGVSMKVTITFLSSKEI